MYIQILLFLLIRSPAEIATKTQYVSSSMPTPLALSPEWMLSCIGENIVRPGVYVYLERKGSSNLEYLTSYDLVRAPKGKITYAHRHSFKLGTFSWSYTSLLTNVRFLFSKEALIHIPQVLYSRNCLCKNQIAATASRCVLLHIASLPPNYLKSSWAASHRPLPMLLPVKINVNFAFTCSPFLIFKLTFLDYSSFAFNARIPLTAQHQSREVGVTVSTKISKVGVLSRSPTTRARPFFFAGAEQTPWIAKEIIQHHTKTGWMKNHTNMAPSPDIPSFVTRFNELLLHRDKNDELIKVC